ncbi:MAG: molybdate ABC transporter substrate-binding protein [Bryobacteraceae bacterium]
MFQTMFGFRDARAAFAVLILLAACSRASKHDSLRIAAAADLRFAFPALSQRFHATHPETTLAPVYGSSGNYYSQIRNGAPFDVFLSADVEYPKRLVAEGAAVADSLFLYGTGRLVVWVPAQSPLDLDRLGIHALEDPSVHHAAIANPLHAPYGRASEAALRSLGVYDRIAPKLVMGENIAQTFEFVESGSAEAGLVAESLTLAPAMRGKGRTWEIPADAYPPLEQCGVILSRAAASPAAAQFRAWMMGPEARAILTQYGFSLPGH